MNSLRNLIFLVYLLYIRSFHKVLLNYNIVKYRSILQMKSLDCIAIKPIARIQGEITLPGSKSLTNRVLLLSALSVGETNVKNVLESADTRYMLDALKHLGIDLVENKETKTVNIKGNGGPFRKNEKVELYLGNAGTAMRPMTGILCAGEGEFILDGNPRMRERPIIDLVDGLKQIGVDISCSDTGCPPVVIKTKGIKGGEASISGKISSQYLSALLMTGPLATGDVTLKIKDELMSAPYVHMTMNLMRKFGATVTCTTDNKVFVTSPSKYISPKDIFIEGDASSASYFLAGGVITGGPVTVFGCGSDSIQGDSRFADVLRKMGATVSYTSNSITVSRDINTPLIGIDEDCGDIPDVAMTLAIVGIFAKGKTIIRNVYNWRVKETERMIAMVNELTKLGVKVEEGRDYLVVEGLKDGETLNNNVNIETYDDHRVAMCFSLAACGGVTVNILDPGCTSKTFPDYFQKLSNMSVNKNL